MQSTAAMSQVDPSWWILDSERLGDHNESLSCTCPPCTTRECCGFMAHKYHDKRADFFSYHTHHPTSTLLPFPPPFSTMSDSTHHHQETRDSRSPEEYERLANLHDSFTPVWLTETIQLGPLLPSDKDSLLEYLNNPEIYQNLIGPPQPYTPKDADEWIRGRVDRMTKQGTPLNFVFRDMTTGKAVGSVGVTNESDDNLDGDDTG